MSACEYCGELSVHKPSCRGKTCHFCSGYRFHEETCVSLIRCSDCQGTMFHKETCKKNPTRSNTTSTNTVIV